MDTFHKYSICNCSYHLRFDQDRLMMVDIFPKVAFLLAQKDSGENFRSTSMTQFVLVKDIKNVQMFFKALMLLCLKFVQSYTFACVCIKLIKTLAGIKMRKEITR
ncbi:hypothetical protein BpHYR1_049392 [Brachionus plicatilis]|uniref:Uncharacterized protein n=1 Tax=Brachionus plicatilis TaxID=10195 RepID=A0A3M7RDC0_BRAPC|nr:hypothetical protein BpHYR1_049392 [Brachionus plicatilis]